MQDGTQDVIVVLGGGGARGFAHVGALRAIEEAGLRVRALAGCSFGAIVGAMFASGADADRLEEIAEKVRYDHILRLGEPGGVVAGDGIRRELERFLPERFEDLDVPLLMTAVDLQKGELVVLNTGPLIPALRATSSIPGLIAPLHMDDRWLLDGGILNNLPVDLARTMGPEPVIAVDVAVPADRHVDIPEVANAWERMRTMLQPQRATALALFMKSFDVPQALITRMRLTMAPPDLLIVPPLPVDMGIEQFGRRKEAMRHGYEAAQRAIASWRPKAVEEPQAHDGG